MSYERDFYTVNQDGTISLHGWIEERDNDLEGFFDDEMPRHTFVFGDWPDVYEPDGKDMTDWACPYQQYNDDLHYEEAIEFVNTFYDGKPGEHLPLRDVSEDTPCGEYWCYFEEE